MDEEERMNPQLMRIKDVASLLARPRSVVYQMVADGELPAVRHGRSIRLDRADVLAWIEEHRSRGGSPDGGEGEGTISGEAA